MVSSSDGRACIESSSGEELSRQGTGDAGMYVRRILVRKSGYQFTWDTVRRLDCIPSAVGSFELRRMTGSRCAINSILIKLPGSTLGIMQ